MRNAYSTDFKTRADNLERIQEYSFSIILYWNRLEAILKVLYYYKHIDKEYPETLFFINRSWSTLKNAYDGNQENYKTILGDRGKSIGCLWHTRDLIVHTNHVVCSEQYKVFKSAVIWLINQLLSNLPPSQSACHSTFLAHKKKITKK